MNIAVSDWAIFSCKRKMVKPEEYMLFGKSKQAPKSEQAKREDVLYLLFSPKLFATEGPRCPVAMLQPYIAKRPPDMLTLDSLFNLTVRVLILFGTSVNYLAKTL